MKILLLGFGKSNKDVLPFLPLKAEITIMCSEGNNDHRTITYEQLSENMEVFDMLIVSPFFSENSKEYQLCKLLCKEVTNEFDYCFRLINKNVITIGVTGSNGKTSTVTLLADILTKKGYKVFKLENIGTTLASQLDEINDNDILIFEISSFQSSLINNIMLDYLLVTNLESNHLNKHFSKNTYFASKLRLKLFAKKVYCLEQYKQFFQEENCEIITNKNESKSYYFKTLLPVIEALLMNFNVAEDEVNDFIDCFVRPRFRQEVMGKIGELTYINDSKSTNVSSTNFALASLNDNFIILLLGGIIKSELSELKIPPNCQIFVFGENYEQYKKELNCHTFPCLRDAFLETLKYKYFSGTVLFSPSGSSLAFANYYQRGLAFEELFNEYRTEK